MSHKSRVAAHQTSQPQSITWKAILVSAALLVAITVAAFWRVGRNDFLNYDDNLYVTDNWQVQHGLSAESVKWAFGSEHAYNWHPLTWLSHMTDVSLFGVKPGPMHLINLCIHLAGALLLLGFLIYTTRRVAASWVVAALFAVHPLHVESVAWIAERKDVLAGLFWMATMCAYAVYARRPGLPRYLTVVLFFALGLMAKPMLVTLPLVLLLLDYWPLHRLEFGPALWEKRLEFGGRNTTIYGLVVEKLPLLAMSGVSCVLTIRAQHAAIAAMESLTLPVRLTNAVVSYGRYIAEMVYPAGLAVFYPHPRVAMYGLAAVVLVLLTGGTVLALYLGRKYRYLATGWLWYLITLVPVIGLMQVGDQSHADRYTYLPLIGLFVVAAWVVADAAENRRVLKAVACVSGAVVISILAVITAADLGNWKDTESLCRRAVRVTRNNYLMENNLALELVIQGRIDEALTHAQRAFEIRPDVPQVLSTMGIVMASQKRCEDALTYYFAALAKKPNQKELNSSIAAAYLSMNRPADALPYARRATELDPHWAKAWLQLSIALNDTGRVPEAAAALAKSKELRGGKSW
jgi:protein O-mannosyl-transferase